MDKRWQRPTQHVERAIEIRIVAAVFDLETGVRDGRAIATEHDANLSQGHCAADVRELHRDLARFGDIANAARPAPEVFGVDAEDRRNGEVDRKAPLIVTKTSMCLGTRNASVAHLPCRGKRGA
jgi:hypothetical protein